jgi:hypothetical protein
MRNFLGHHFAKSLILLVCPTGIEPVTLSLEGLYSIHILELNDVDEIIN